MKTVYLTLPIIFEGQHVRQSEERNHMNRVSLQ